MNNCEVSKVLTQHDGVVHASFILFRNSDLANIEDNFLNYSKIAGLPNILAAFDL